MEFQFTGIGILVVDIEKRWLEPFGAGIIGGKLRIKAYHKIPGTQVGICFQTDRKRDLHIIIRKRPIQSHCRRIARICFVKCDVYFCSVPATKVCIQIFVQKLFRRKYYIRAFRCILHRAECHGYKIGFDAILRADKRYIYLSGKVLVDIHDFSVQKSSVCYFDNFKQVRIIADNRRAGSNLRCAQTVSERKLLLDRR